MTTTTATKLEGVFRSQGVTELEGGCGSKCTSMVNLHVCIHPSSLEWASNQLLSYPHLLCTQSLFCFGCMSVYVRLLYCLFKCVVQDRIWEELHTYRGLCSRARNFKAISTIFI